MMGRRSARWSTVAALCGLLLGGAGCGEMTTRTWIHIIEEESGGFVSLLLPNGVPAEFPMLRLQGGFLTKVTIRTSDLPGPMGGQITLEDVRIAGEVAAPIGMLCTWNDPTGSSGGPLVVDVFGGSAESSMFLDAKATTTISEAVGLDSVDFEEEIDFDIGAAFDMVAFFNAFLTGSADGLFATTSTISSEMEMAGLSTVFAMNSSITNGPEPPTFDADLLDFCGDHFASQGVGDSYVHILNVKSSYLRHAGKDRPLDPLVVSLDEIGAQPGDVLQMAPVGTYALLPALSDGPETKLGAVFSSTDEVLSSDNLWRIPGAIDAGQDIATWPSIFCFLGVCDDLGGDDILQDFRVDPLVGVTIPPGAEFVVVAPIDGFRIWGDNTSLGFGVQIDVLPQ